MSSRISLTPHYPTYDEAQVFMRIACGTPWSQYEALWKDILAHRGTPQNPTDWSNPEEWIPQRLTGDSRELALHIWRESDGLINLRYNYRIRSFYQHHMLTRIDDGELLSTDKGDRFLRNDPETLREIDEREGILIILKRVAEGATWSSEMLPEFRAYCHERTTLNAHKSIQNAMFRRLDNLISRGLITRDSWENPNGYPYSITAEGSAYLKSASGVHRLSTQVQNGNDDATLVNLVQQLNDATRHQLADHLKNMDPFRFEQLIGELLNRMGYENVNVTSQSNDKGVDVVGEIELGITRVREVIQVKRQQSNVGRGILDSLRGSLHRFDEDRATIITTSSFTKGAKDAALEKGAAPITLIDGERLLEYLIKYGIGIRRREIRILEFDAESLSEFESEEELEAAAMEEPESE